MVSVRVFRKLFFVFSLNVSSRKKNSMFLSGSIRVVIRVKMSDCWLGRLLMLICRKNVIRKIFLMFYRDLDSFWVCGCLVSMVLNIRVFSLELSFIDLKLKLFRIRVISRLSKISSLLWLLVFSKWNSSGCNRGSLNMINVYWDGVWLVVRFIIISVIRFCMIRMLMVIWLWNVCSLCLDLRILVVRMVDENDRVMVSSRVVCQGRFISR